MKKIVHNQLYKFPENHKCIYSLQFGFRKKYSTNQALIEITENIHKALDTDQRARGVFVDLKKAFDTVNHNILVDKLNHYGVRNKESDWFKSYLQDRCQYTSVLGYESNTKPMLHGVPQGSVLGPLLFLIYINDLHTAIKYSKVFHFADDTNLLNICKNYKQMRKQINIDLKILYKWMLANKISLNTDKTELIIFHKPAHKPPFIKIKLNGEKLYPSDKIKYVGVWLDATLSFQYQCISLRQRLSRASGILCKARHYMQQGPLTSLYYAIFSSNLTYGCQVWGQTDNIYTKSIFKLQDRAIRIMNFTYGYSDVWYNVLNILKLSDFVKMQNCLLVHKALTGDAPDCFNGYFLHLNMVNNHITRHTTMGCVQPETHNTVSYGINSIANKCITSWNDMSHLFAQPSVLNDISVINRSDFLDITTKELKKKITNYFLHSYFPDYHQY